MHRFISFTAVALALVAGCSGEGADGDLVGRWRDSFGNEMEFSSDGRYASYNQEILGEGTYAAQDGTLTIDIETSHVEFPDSPSLQEVPYWTDGDTLQLMFSSPDHDSEDIAGTWRRMYVLGDARPDGGVSREVFEVVTELAADGTVIEETFRDGIPQGADIGTYTVLDGAIHITWDRGDYDQVVMRDLRNGRMGGITFFRF